MKRLVIALFISLTALIVNAQDTEGKSYQQYQQMLKDSSERMLQRYYQQNPDRIKEIETKSKEEEKLAPGSVEATPEAVDTPENPKVNEFFQTEDDGLEFMKAAVIKLNEERGDPPTIAADTIPILTEAELEVRRLEKAQRQAEAEAKRFAEEAKLAAEKRIADSIAFEDSIRLAAEREKIEQQQEEHRAWLRMQQLKTELEELEGKKSKKSLRTMEMINEEIRALQSVGVENAAETVADEVQEIMEEDTTHRVMVDINDTLRSIEGVTNLPEPVSKVGSFLFACIQDEANFGAHASKIVYSNSYLRALHEADSNKGRLPDQLARMVNSYRYSIKNKVDKIRYAGKHLGFTWEDVQLVGMEHKMHDELGEITLQLEYNMDMYYVNVRGIDTTDSTWTLGLDAKITFQGSEGQQNTGKDIMYKVFSSIQNNSYDILDEELLLSLEDFMYLAKNTGKKRLNKDDFVKVRNQYIKELIVNVQEYHRIGVYEEIDWNQIKITEVDFRIEGKRVVAQAVLRFIFEDQRGRKYRVLLKDLNIIDGVIKIGNKIEVLDLTPQVLLARKMVEALQDVDSVSLFIRNVPIFVEFEYIMSTDGGHIIPGDVENLIDGRLQLITEMQLQMNEMIKEGKSHGIDWTKAELDEKSIGARIVPLNDRLRLLHLSFYVKQGDITFEVTISNCVILNGIGKIISGFEFRKL